MPDRPKFITSTGGPAAPTFICRSVIAMNVESTRTWKASTKLSPITATRTVPGALFAGPIAIAPTERIDTTFDCVVVFGEEPVGPAGREAIADLGVRLRPRHARVEGMRQPQYPSRHDTSTTTEARESSRFRITMIAPRAAPSRRSRSRRSTSSRVSTCASPSTRTVATIVELGRSSPCQRRIPSDHRIRLAACDTHVGDCGLISRASVKRGPTAPARREHPRPRAVLPVASGLDTRHVTIPRFHKDERGPRQTPQARESYRSRSRWKSTLRYAHGATKVHCVECRLGRPLGTGVVRPVVRHGHRHRRVRPRIAGRNHHAVRVASRKEAGGRSPCARSCPTSARTDSPSSATRTARASS